MREIDDDDTWESIDRRIFLHYERQIRERHKKELSGYRALHKRMRVPLSARKSFFRQLKERHRKELSESRALYERIKPSR
jgi:hypothetical protein